MSESSGGALRIISHCGKNARSAILQLLEKQFDVAAEGLARDLHEAGACPRNLK